MSALHDQLHALAAHVRDPAAHAGPPGIEDRRLAVYRELVFNNLDGLLAGNFPVIRRTLADADWQALLRRFLASHRSDTPLFTRLGLEFIAFLESEEHPAHPWLPELAHYEWAELGLQLSDTAPPQVAGGAPGSPPGQALLDGIPVLSPLAWPLAYRWPVHRIGDGLRPSEPLAAPVFLAVYRDRDDAVRFLEINAATARLIELMRAEPLLPGRELALRVAAELRHDDPQTVIAGARTLLEMLRERDIVLGTRLTGL